MIDRYRNYKPQNYRTNVRSKKRGNKKVLFLTLIIGISIFYMWKKNFTTDQNVKTDTPIANASTAPVPKVKAERISTDNWNNLGQQVNAIISENSSIDIAVTVIDLTTNTKANYGIQEAFVGASTTKVLTAVTFLHDVEQGKRKLDSSSKNLLKQMINQSNNEAWYTLNRQVTYTAIEKYAKSQGLSSFDAQENVITASDIALLLQKLYKREVLNEDHTRLLLSYMQNTNNETMIPQEVPVGSVFYHKYGQLEDRLHDVAIIDFQNKPIVLAIYTKGGEDTTANYNFRTSLIRSLAKAVFDNAFAPAPQQ